MSVKYCFDFLLAIVFFLPQSVCNLARSELFAAIHSFQAEWIVTFIAPWILYNSILTETRLRYFAYNCRVCTRWLIEIQLCHLAYSYC